MVEMIIAAIGLYLLYKRDRREESKEEKTPSKTWVESFKRTEHDKEAA